MKHLKLFESFSELYEPYDYTQDGYWLEFTRKNKSISEVDKKKIMDKFGFEPPRKGSGYSKPRMEYRPLPKVRFIICVYEGVDAWWYVSIELQEYGHSSGVRMYKCDDWDGLMRCIQDKVMDCNMDTLTRNDIETAGNLYEGKSNKKDDVEDCFLELTDTPYNWKLEEFRPGVIKFTGEIIGDGLSMKSGGKYKPNESTFPKFIYGIEAHGKFYDGEAIPINRRNDWHIIEDDTSQGLYPSEKRKYSNKKSYKVTKEILGHLESCLSKLNRFVAKSKKDFNFIINIYEVVRGTCIVVYIEY